MLVGSTASPKMPLKTVRADVLVTLGAQGQAESVEARVSPVIISGLSNIVRFDACLCAELLIPVPSRPSRWGDVA